MQTRGTQVSQNAGSVTLWINAHDESGALFSVWKDDLMSGSHTHVGSNRLDLA